MAFDNARLILINNNRAVTTIEADEASAQSDFLKKEKKERERERERERAESQFQLVLIIDHDTLSWLLVHFKSLNC